MSLSYRIGWYQMEPPSHSARSADPAAAGGVNLFKNHHEKQFSCNTLFKPVVWVIDVTPWIKASTPLCWNLNLFLNRLFKKKNLILIFLLLLVILQAILCSKYSRIWEYVFPLKILRMSQCKIWNLAREDLKKTPNDKILFVVTVSVVSGTFQQVVWITDHFSNEWVFCLIIH